MSGQMSIEDYGYSDSSKHRRARADGYRNTRSKDGSLSPNLDAAHADIVRRASKAMGISCKSFFEMLVDKYAEKELFDFQNNAIERQLSRMTVDEKDRLLRKYLLSEQ